MSPSAGRARRQAIVGSAVATGAGDDGTTGLLYGGRVAKDSLAVEAYGTIDETVAALGLARAELGDLPAEGLAELSPLLLRLQRELFVAGAELATGAGSVDRLRDGVTRVDEPMLLAVEADLATWEARVTMPREFVVPGATRLSAALELARVTARRAERRVVALEHAGHPLGRWIVPWVNRLADLLWVLARAAEQGQGQASLPVRTEPRSSRRQ
ncbi:MAG: cob(I)yrinic acid a,c-diamide adenosyltransferase [Chloroflexota bacterium]